MLQSRRFLSLRKARFATLVMLAAVPLMTGCIAELSAITFGAVLWLDLALIPIRSILGAIALDLVNTL